MRVTKKVIRARFDAVKEAIRANPEKYDQGNFCGTPCCIGGWLDIIVDGLVVHKRKDVHQVIATALASIGVKKEPWLFRSPVNWPDDLWAAWAVGATSKKARVEVTCQAIDRYVAERGA